MLELAFAGCIFVGWIGSVCAHEFGHALVAYWGGDTSVKDKGYLTFNPLKYTDIQLSLVLPLLFLLLGGIPLPGGAVYINQHQLRNRWWQSAVSAAGPLATLLCAAGLSLGLRQLPGGVEVLSLSYLRSIFNDPASLQGSLQSHWLAYGLILLTLLQMAALVLNLLPIPPLDGYGIIQPWLPVVWQRRLRGFSRYGFLLVFAAFWLVPAIGQLFWAIVFTLTALLFQFPVDPLFGSFIVTYQAFQKGSRPLLAIFIIVAVIVAQVRKQKQFPRGRSPQRKRVVPQSPQTHLATIESALGAALATNPKVNPKVNPTPARFSDSDPTHPSPTHASPTHASPANPSGPKPDDPEASSQTSYPPTVFERDPRNTNVSDLDSGASSPGELLFRKAMVLLRLDRVSEAIAALQQSLQVPNAITFTPPLPPTGPDLNAPLDRDLGRAKVWYELGRLQHQQRSLAPALEALQEAVQLDPQFASAWYELGLVQLELGQQSAALQSFVSLERLLPRLTIAPYLQGVVLGQQQHWDAALTAFDRALNHNPRRADTWFDRGFVLMQLGRYGPALTDLDRGLDLDPDRLLAYYHKACCHSQQGDLDRAMQFLQIALAGDDAGGTAETGSIGYGGEENRHSSDRARSDWKRSDRSGGYTGGDREEWRSWANQSGVNQSLGSRAIEDPLLAPLRDHPSFPAPGI